MQIYEHMVKGLVCKGYRMKWITYKHVHICGVPTYLKSWISKIHNENCESVQSAQSLG